MESDSNSDISSQPNVPVKTKRAVNEKTQAALAEGRKKLNELNKIKREEKSQMMKEVIDSKAAKIAERKLKKLQEIKDSIKDDESSEDEQIVARKPKPYKDEELDEIQLLLRRSDPKAKKLPSKKDEIPAEIIEEPVKQVAKVKKPQKVVYYSDSSSEEEVVYKKKPKSKKVVEEQEKPSKNVTPRYNGLQFF
jgi:hypothetical protein